MTSAVGVETTCREEVSSIPISTSRPATVEVVVTFVSTFSVIVSTTVTVAKVVGDLLSLRRTCYVS